MYVALVHTRNRKTDAQRWKGLKGCLVVKVGSDGTMSDVDIRSEVINYLPLLMKPFPAERF